ncbi:MAG: DUF3263 domain-containing protein [Acidimicrobiia bacterium]
METTALTPRETAILDFERMWCLESGSKELAIRAHFGFSPTQYYRILSTLLDVDAAVAYDPLTVKRLRRRRDSRRRARIVGSESHPGFR